ncbi:hypothetical protein [Thiosocius teredinicola]|uniref:hypothetical protein n=1 Tax=Thiosocius teredinicola TaxID=1973002 RepID=UPI0013DE6A6F
MRIEVIGFPLRFQTSIKVGTGGRVTARSLPEAQTIGTPIRSVPPAGTPLLNLASSDILSMAESSAK